MMMMKWWLRVVYATLLLLFANFDLAHGWISGRRPRTTLDSTKAFASKRSPNMEATTPTKNVSRSIPPPSCKSPVEEKDPTTTAEPPLQIMRNNKFVWNTVWVASLLGWMFFTAPISILPQQQQAWAAPPIAVIAEELGYFPVQNQQGEVVYIPKRVGRPSTDQAVSLAQYLQQQNIRMAGTYWCPHTSRQKELFGTQAWNRISYIECASKGYQAQTKLCIQQKVEGYPTWVKTNGEQLAGERSLTELAQWSKYPGSFSAQVEETSAPPPPIGGGACK